MSNKYRKRIYPISNDESSCHIDVYSVLEAFEVKCPARQHALKKILCAGQRQKGDVLQDIREAIEALQRALELEQQRQNILAHSLEYGPLLKNK